MSYLAVQFDIAYCTCAFLHRNVSVGVPMVLGDGYFLQNLCASLNVSSLLLGALFIYFYYFSSIYKSH